MGNKPQHDDDIPQGLSRELSRLLGPDSGLTTTDDLDQRVLAEARRVLLPQHRLHMRLRRAAPLAAAAGLAIAGWIGFTLWMTPNAPTRSGAPGGSPTSSGIRAEADTAPYDIDGSGHVDIIDAFRVARALDRGHPIDTAWDVSGDGVVDAADVDAIARASVALGESSS